MSGPSMYMALMLFAIFLTSKSYAGYDDGARYAFLASTNHQSIYVVDLHKRVLADTIALDTAPDMISASGNLKALVIANRKSKGLVLLDLSSDQLARHSYPLSISPDYVDVSPLGETVAIYDRESQILEIHALRRRAILLRAEQVRSKDQFTFNLDGSSVYWVDQGTGTLNAVDLWSNRKVLQLTKAELTKTGLAASGLAQPGADLSAVSRSTDGLLGFVSNARENKVYVINLRDFSKLTEIRVGDRPGRPWGTADGRYMLIPNEGDGTVTAISTLSLQNLYTIATVDTPISINPGWLDTTAAVIGEQGDLAFIDVEDGTLSHAYDLESIPHEGIVTSDSRTLAIPVPAKGTVSFFDMRERSLIGRIQGLPGDISAATLAVSNNLCH